MKKEARIITLKKYTDARGSLVFAEENAEIPFKIRRFYCIYGIGDNTVRGRHAHKTSDIVLFCLSGGCNVRLTERDGIETLFSLCSPETGLYIPAELWREMYGFSSDCVLMALSSDFYDENDYIRDFDEFMKGAEL